MRAWILAVPPALALALLCRIRADARQPQGNATTETISVTGARPVAKAMDLIEKRYAVLIDYLDPRYAAPQDEVGISYRPGRVTVGPRIRSLSVQYVQVPGPPKGVPYILCSTTTMGCAPVTEHPAGGITSLIRQVLDQFAADGGQIFGVRKMEMPYGPRWEVYPKEARNHAGTFTYQPDILGTKVFLPNAPQVPAGMVVGTRKYWRGYVPKARQAARSRLGSVYQQIEAAWGPRFKLAGGSVGKPGSAAYSLMGGETVSAGRALAEMIGATRVLRLFYAPDDGMYYPNVVLMPYRPWPKPAPAPPPMTGDRVWHEAPVAGWVMLARTSGGVAKIQGALVKTGYLRGRVTTRWDAKAVAALRRFQASRGLRPTGKVDLSTAAKLEPYLPLFPPDTRPRNPLGTNLSMWYQSTRRGNRDIQRALAEEGFYSGALTGETADAKTSRALKDFQRANGLKPTGLLDEATQIKLAPILLKMKN